MAAGFTSYGIEPLLVYKDSLESVLHYQFPGDPGSETTDRESSIVIDNLLSLKTLDIGSTGSVLSLSLPATDAKAGAFQVESFIDFKGRTYIIKEAEEKVSGNERILEVIAERWWYIFLRGGVITPLVQAITDPGVAISTILSRWFTGAVPWEVGSFTSTSLYPWSSDSGGNALEDLKKIEEMWGGYLVFDHRNRRVSLLDDPGLDNGVYFTYERDVKSMTRTVDTSDLVTRLFPFYSNGLLIASSTGKYYEENFQWTDRRYEGVVTFDESYTSDAALLYTREVLKTLSMPKITYSVALTGLHGREGINVVNVLDKVSVYDSEFKQVVKARVEELSIDWLNPENSTITLGSRLNNLSNSGSLVPPNFGGEGNAPATPTDLVVVSNGYYDGDIPLSAIAVGWSPVTKDVKGGNIEISYYMLDVSPISTYNTPQTTSEVYGLEPGLQLQVSVCAVSTKGVPSRWSDPVTVTTVAP